MLKKGFCSRKSGFYGITRLSSRGQIVLPKNLRDVLGVEEGDAFFVISNKAESGIILLKEDSVENFFDKLRERG
ncbi:MAG: hypothetical protein ACD_63C00255G0001 [uncultured bacterium]|nr:MAG: hypothetical protein ACD_63C00255G0001 [uncultured bacterium]